ncbi:hypothetical protein ACFSE0_12525 [Ochrobactrum teleogrylli]|uniref:Uncharacterized protein n=1 Tax=Ochrobactrum teleogrylli TaxID=2479765 RepID=A0ABY2Y3G1_9HYPH|nr:hypothetical protein [[Ochrobactrum] teleogrylli]TNV15847.1 hypothetical protein FIC94_11205 [[Ochrobactrum] teleogrylli]
MFKNPKALLTATVALFSVTATQAAFLPTQDTYTYESTANPASDDVYYLLPFSISGNSLPASLWCSMVSANWKYGQPIARNGVQAGYITLTDISTCALRMPKNMAAGMYEVTLGWQGQSKTYSFIYKDNELISTTNLKNSYKSGEPISIVFSKPYSSLASQNVPRELPVKNTSYLMTIEGSISPEKTTSYTFQVIDLQSEQKIDVNFTVIAPEKPEEKPEGDNKITCNTFSAPASGAKFVFRYPIGRACS